MTQSASARILIVDDEQHVCNLLARFLEAEGYECVTAYSGEEALQRLEEGPFELVIADIMMPGMSGIDLLNVIKPVFTDTAVLMVTAVDDKETGVLAVESGAFGYIIKPFDRNEILINAANALERRRLTLAARAHRSEGRSADEVTIKRREPIRVRPDVILEYLREGVDELELMKRFDLSAKALQSLVDQLTASGRLEQPVIREVFKDGGTVGIDPGDVTDRPATREKPVISAREVVDCLKSGMSDPELMERFGISAKGLQSLFRKLVARGAISSEELDRRMSETHNWAILED